MKKVLILLSTYNGEKYLQEQLSSLTKQREIEIFYLIRDDGSIDGTKKLLEEFKTQQPNVELIYGDNVGSCESFKILLQLTEKYLKTIDFIAFCDQDDIWLEKKLSVASQQLNKMPTETPSLYCSNLIVVDENKNPVGEMRKRERVEFSKGSSLVESIATGCTMVFNKRTIEIFLANVPKYMTMHDLWIYHLCIFLGNVYYDDIPQILYRQHSSNVIGAKNSFFTKWKSRFRSIKKFGGQREREKEAKEIFRLYRNLLTVEDKKLLKIVIGYRKGFREKRRFLFPPKDSNLFMSSNERNFWLKIRIILGLV